MKIEIAKGANICAAAQVAIRTAEQSGERVSFEFNGIELEVHKDSFYGDIATIYDLKHMLRANGVDLAD